MATRVTLADQGGAQQGRGESRERSRKDFLCTTAGSDRRTRCGGGDGQGTVVGHTPRARLAPRRRRCGECLVEAVRAESTLILSHSNVGRVLDTHSVMGITGVVPDAKPPQLPGEDIRTTS